MYNAWLHEQIIQHHIIGIINCDIFFFQQLGEVERRRGMGGRHAELETAGPDEDKTASGFR